MTALVLIPYDERGREIVHELGQGTEEHPIEVRRHAPLEYNLWIKDVDIVGFEAMLDRIDPGWRDHLGRTA
jgi:hypothetical protein